MRPNCCRAPRGDPPRYAGEPNDPELVQSEHTPGFMPHGLSRRHRSSQGGGPLLLADSIRHRCDPRWPVVLRNSVQRRGHGRVTCKANGIMKMSARLTNLKEK